MAGALLAASACAGNFSLAAPDLLASERPKAGRSRPSPEGIKQSGKATFAQEPAAAVNAGDPILSLLAARGLLRPLEDSALVRSVRDTASELVMVAMNFLGVPYRRGGNSSATGFDCSGFTRHIFESSIGLVLPRRADEQATSAGLLKVARNELKPGDLVFFNTLRRSFSHVGIYLGDDKFIHAPRSGGQVRVETMQDGYWSKRFTGARRADGQATATNPAADLR